MLENEPTGDAPAYREGSAEQRTEETTAPTADQRPKRIRLGRRRAASRPAGPPGEQDVAASAGNEPLAEEQGAPHPTVPAVTFQPPTAVFQPPPPPESLGGDSTDSTDSSEHVGEEAEARRRRRRGGRGRGRSKKAAGTAEPAEEPTASDTEPALPIAEPAAGDETGDAEGEPAADGSELPGEEASGATTRRRRRRRRVTSQDVEEPGPDEPERTVVRVREPRAERPTDEVQSVKGSTRLEAKKQRRREGREQGRRRPPIVTEAEFLARRESVDRAMVIRQNDQRTQIAVLEDGVLVEHYVDKANRQSYVGNIYLGKVQNVLPSMEAAFVDIGKGRNAVLYAGEVNFDMAGLEGQPKRIESALKSGQSVLVQVTKDPVGHKGARLTSQISLPGRYLVYVPNGSMTGISRKLPEKERNRLKQILKEVMPDTAGVIVRTAAEGATEEELRRDVARLTAQWDNIQRKSGSATPPDLLYAEPDLTIRVVRDIFNEDFSKLVVAGDSAWDMVDEYVRYVAPHLADRVSRWTEDEDVFAAHRIDEQLAKALDRKVWLPSGGSLIIDHTEAMTVIDVNTGKFTGQGGNLEETVTKNNLEAAEEIVRQLRLRDVGGIIVIDFIDMVLEGNRDLVLRRLLECLARDRTKHQVAEVTSLGLVQMTRKRVSQGLLDAFSTPCEACNGRGVHTFAEPVDTKPEAKGDGGRRRRRTASPRKAEAADRTEIPATVDDEESVEEAAEEALEAASEPVGTALEEIDPEPLEEEPDGTKPKRRRSRRSRAAVSER